MTQLQVINNLQAAKRMGVNLGNVNTVLSTILDAQIYLVTNTPEAKK